MKNILILFAGVLFLYSCGGDKYKFPQAEFDMDKVEAIRIHRYGKALFEIDTTHFQTGLKNIQSEFALFLDADLNDTANVNQIYAYVSDTQLINIYHKVIEIYPDLEPVERELALAFARYQILFPQKAVPTIYSYISDLYYEAPVWLNDTLMVIALDVYLGGDFPLYAQLGLPYYKVRTMTPENLPVDVMKTVYLTELAPESRSRTLLDRMIEGGKMLCFLDAVLPDVPDSIKISYPSAKWEWAETNEKNIWAYLVENKLLYSTDYQTQTKLIQDAPFTNGFSNESPPRLGIYIGWKIVADFLKNNPEVSLNEMIQITDSQALLEVSGYKP